MFLMEAGEVLRSFAEGERWKEGGRQFAKNSLVSYCAIPYAPKYATCVCLSKQKLHTESIHASEKGEERGGGQNMAFGKL